MARLFRTRRARQDLIEIWQYVAKDDRAAADNVLDRIDDVCRLLTENPRLGPERNDIRPGLRYAVAGTHLILYRIVDDGVEIVRIAHGRRNLLNLL
jgi:toxin ParE1/3/4